IDWRSADRRGNVGLTYFTQDFTNLITFSFAAGGYENIAQAETEGVELDLGYQLTQWLRMDASYAWIDAEDDTGQQLVRVPEHSADLQLSISPNERLNVNLLMRYNDEEADANGEVASWTRVDVSANYRISNQLSAFMRVENLLEEDYQQILGYGTPDLAVFGGVRLSF
ncbi:MAG: TonB-dependent receptor, partial [Pseudomonadota bacterium]